MEICNSAGWFALRRSHLDPFLRATNGIMYEDEAPTFAALDGMVDKGSILWVDHWLERYAETGATEDMMIARIGAWFAQRKTLGALTLVDRTLVQIGRCNDLTILNVELATDDPSAAAIRADTTFAVKRRSLH